MLVPAAELGAVAEFGDGWNEMISPRPDGSGSLRRASSELAIRRALNTSVRGIHLSGPGLVRRLARVALPGTGPGSVGARRRPVLSVGSWPVSW